MINNKNYDKKGRGIRVIRSDQVGNDMDEASDAMCVGAMHSRKALLGGGGHKRGASFVG